VVNFEIFQSPRDGGWVLGRSGPRSLRVVGSAVPSPGVGWMGVSVSCLVAGREPCLLDGETGDPSIRLVLYWGSTVQCRGWGQCQSGGRAVRPWRRVMKLLSDSVLGLLEGGIGELSGGRAGALRAGWRDW